MKEDTQQGRTTGESGNTQPEVEPRRSGSTTALWGAVVALTVALVGLAAYGTLTLQKHNIQLAELPSLQESLGLLGERLDATEAKLRTWAADWDALEVRLDNLSRKIAYNRELARKQAQDLVAQAQERMEAELAERDQAVDARFSLLESGQEAERARLGQLREEITDVRRQTGHDLGALHQQMARGERNLDDLARQLERRRVDFELAKEQTSALAPGVSLRITKTDRRFQRVKGWLWLMPDRRTLWVRELGVQQPLVFYHKGSDQPNELVITRVAKDAVIGYLLLPAEQGVSLGAEAAPARRDPFTTGSTTGGTTAPAGLN